MFALTHQPIPCVIEEVEVYVGGDVPVANYKFTGSQELADEVSKWVGDRAAVLMANHGLLTVGKRPKDALKIANLVERTAEIIWGATAARRDRAAPRSTREKLAPIYKMLPRACSAERSALAQRCVSPSLTGSITASTRSSAATMSLKARIATVLSSSASRLDDAAAPQHVVDEDQRRSAAAAAAAARSSSA